MKFVIPCGDWNGHIGNMTAAGIHGGFGFGERNENGEKVLDFSVANNFVIGNIFFQKRESCLVTYHSAPCKTQIDFYSFPKNT